MSLREQGAVLLISCYELGHQPLAAALPLGFLRRAGFAPDVLDIAVDPFDEDKVARARFVGISVPMHTALRLGVRVAARVREINPTAAVCFYGLYAALNADYLLDHGADYCIGGEVEASIVEPYTNKQHHGFLGHSYLGSWINLGAGTSNSDLKNTYGNVKMEYRGEQVPTGMQFVGCIMGDYAKSAINTGIFTGKTVGCCSMLYGFVTTNVPSFVNYARLFGQVTELPPEVMIATQQRMFMRRSVAQRECDIALIRSMYDLTRHERQLAGEQ